MGEKFISTEKKVLGMSISGFLKEGIAATIGIIIILGTFILLWPALTASPVDVTSAQGIFSILGGWGGVVIGYYFGRIPAEKAAANAEEVAKTARKERDEAEATKTQVLADSSISLATKEASFGELEKKLDKYIKIIDDLVSE